MSITFFPPVFDTLGYEAHIKGHTTCQSPAHKMSVYWHGTLAENLESIFANGLDPAKTGGVNRVCLATKAHVAHFYGRINAHNPNKSVVLIKIPGALLDETQMCIETGAFSCGLYGSKLEQRQDLTKPNLWDKLRGVDPASGLTWQSFQAKSDTVGYLDTIKVTPDMIDWRTVNMHHFHHHLNLITDSSIREYTSGIPNYDQHLFVEEAVAA